MLIQPHTKRFSDLIAYVFFIFDHSVNFPFSKISLCCRFEAFRGVCLPLCKYGVFFFENSHVLLVFGWFAVCESLALNHLQLGGSSLLMSAIVDEYMYSGFCPGVLIMKSCLPTLKKLAKTNSLP